MVDNILYHGQADVQMPACATAAAAAPALVLPALATVLQMPPAIDRFDVIC
jgi:hypothetical protein